CHRLSLERLVRKSEWHLGTDHAEQILFERQDVDQLKPIAMRANNQIAAKPGATHADRFAARPIHVRHPFTPSVATRSRGVTLDGIDHMEPHRPLFPAPAIDLQSTVEAPHLRATAGERLELGIL